MNRLMNLALMMGITSAYTFTSDYVFGHENISSGSESMSPRKLSYRDKQKCKPKQQHEFTVKGVKIMASSRKDAIKKYNHGRR